MREITKRAPQLSKAQDAIGKVAYSNMFPILMGKLLYVQKDKCYFEMLENEEYPKYNNCAGQVEYLPEHMVVCMKFEEE